MVGAAVVVVGAAVVVVTNLAVVVVVAGAAVVVVTRPVVVVVWALTVVDVAGAVVVVGAAEDEVVATWPPERAGVGVFFWPEPMAASPINPTRIHTAICAVFGQDRNFAHHAFKPVGDDAGAGRFSAIPPRVVLLGRRRFINPEESELVDHQDC